MQPNRSADRPVYPASVVSVVMATAVKGVTSLWYDIIIYTWQHTFDEVMTAMMYSLDKDVYMCMCMHNVHKSTLKFAVSFGPIVHLNDHL